MVDARAVFLMRATKMLPIGATTARSACGSTTRRRDCQKVSPSALAASACPCATVDEGVTVDVTVEVGVTGTEVYRSTAGGVGAVTPAVPTVLLKAAAQDPSL